MSSDTSSTEGEFDKIKEAVDQHFLTEDLFANVDLKKKNCYVLAKPKSLRNENHTEISHNPFSIKVTPEFQKHVAKHLSRLLDELIDDSEIVFKKKKLKTDRLVHGIKLLRSSKHYLEITSGTESDRKKKKFSKKKNYKYSDYEKRAKEVAVTPEWVLSQMETKYWAPNTKGEVEIVKLNICDKESPLKQSVN